MAWLMAGIASIAVVDSTTTLRAQTASAATYALAIAAKPLPQAVAELSARTGLQVLYTGNQAFQRTSQPVNGSYAPEQALRIMLQGTGISYRFVRPNAVTLDAPGAAAAVGSANGAIALDTIDVQGETAWGPVKGFVASRSATGTKTDTPLIETPQTVDVVTRDEIVTRNAQTVSDAVRYAPGVFQSGSEGFRDYIYSRGFLASQYLNGLRLSNAASWGIDRIEPYFLERVERIGGPASVLYGQASPGGLIAMVSKMPTEQPYHEVGLRGGSYGRTEGFFDFSGPVDPNGQLLYRLTGLGRAGGTQQDFVRDQRIAIAPSLTWKPDTDTTLTILATYQKDPNQGLYYTAPAIGTLFPNPNGKIPTSAYFGDPGYNIHSSESASIGYMFERRINEAWTVRQNLRYSFMDSEFGGVLPFGLEADNRTLDRYAMYDRDKLGQLTLDNQAQVKFDTGILQHTLLAGVDYQRTTLGQTYGFNFSTVPSLDIFAPVGYQGILKPAIGFDTYQVLQQTGVYAQDQIKIGKLSIVGGVRYDWANTVTTDRLAGGTDETNDQALSGRIGAVYAFENGISPYVSFATSFEPTAGTAFGGDPFKPTKGKQYEAGIKYQPPGYRSFFTAAIFDLRKTNATTPDPDHTGFSIQTGEVHAQGLELSAVTSLVDNFNLRASYTHLTAINSKSNDPTTLGKTPVTIPNDTASLWTDYKFTSGIPAGFGIGGGVRFVGASYGDDQNSFQVPNVTLFDAMVSYDFGVANRSLAGVRAAINANNLFDKTYVTSCVSINLCSYGLRRQVLATLSYQW